MQIKLSYWYFDYEGHNPCHTCYMNYLGKRSKLVLGQTNEMFSNVFMYKSPPNIQSDMSTVVLYWQYLTWKFIGKKHFFFLWGNRSGYLENTISLSGNCLITSAKLNLTVTFLTYFYFFPDNFWFMPTKWTLRNVLDQHYNLIFEFMNSLSTCTYKECTHFFLSYSHSQTLSLSRMLVDLMLSLPLFNYMPQFGNLMEK